MGGFNLSEEFEDALDNANKTVHTCQTFQKMKTRKQVKLFDLVMTMATITAIVGAVLNANGYKASFLLWLMTNMVFLIAAWKQKNGWMTVVFGMYFMTSIMGLMVW